MVKKHRPPEPGKAVLQLPVILSEAKDLSAGNKHDPSVVSLPQDDKKE